MLPVERRIKLALSRRKDSSGAAAVEFAIIAPVFILVLVAILVFGLFFTVAHSVQQIAAEAARAAVGGLSDSERVSLALARARTTAESYPLIDPGEMTVDAGSLPGDPDSFRVTVRYNASHLGLGALSQVLPVPGDVIERVAVIRRGGL